VPNGHISKYIIILFLIFDILICINLFLIFTDGYGVNEYVNEDGLEISYPND